MKRAVFAGLVAAGLTACGGGGGSSNSGGETTTPPVAVMEPTALEHAKTFLASVDASLANAAPGSGAQSTALTDFCSLHNGYTKAVSIAEFDANPANGSGSSKYGVGSTRTSIQVLADRTRANSDGSSRRELDVQYQINYADGTTERAGQTLISGSSLGSPMPASQTCVPGQVSASWRFYGNRESVDAQVRAINQRSERYKLIDGTPNTGSAVDYSKFVQFRITDPGNVATYVVVQGPGLPPSGLKMISPRIQRDDPLFNGKRGNYVDWKDSDTFRICRGDAAGVNIVASAADCATFGASGTSFGAFNVTAAAADSTFASIAFVAGGAYSIAVYNDDGWKTVNGQATKTPVVTYTRQLGALPYSAVTLAGASAGSDLYPRIASPAVSTATIASNIRSKTAGSLSLTWNSLETMPDASAFGWGDLYNFVSGRATSTANAWPASRRTELSYPDRGATSALNYTVSAAQPALVTPTYAEFGLELSNRQGRRVLSLVTFE